MLTAISQMSFPYAAPLIVTGMFILTLTYFLKDNLDETGGRAFLIMLLGCATWTLGTAGHILATTYTTSYIWYIIHMAGSYATLGGWLIFAIEYTNQAPRLNTTRNKRILWGIQLALTFIIATQHFHGLAYNTLALVETPFPHLNIVEGPLYWMAFTIGYAYITAGFYLFGKFVLSASKSPRRQATFLVTGVVISIIINIPSRLGYTPFSIDYTPIGLSIFATLVAYALFRHKLFDLTPVARAQIIKTIDDPVLTIDKKHRISDINPAAKHIFPNTEPGDDFTTTAPDTLVDLILDNDNSDHTNDGGAIKADIKLDTPDDTRYYDVHRSHLHSDSTHLGHAIILRDITALKRKQDELVRQNERLDDFASILAHDLRNPLSTAKGWTDAAQDQENVEHLDKVHNAHDRIGNIIDDVLLLARQGNAIEDPEPVDIRETAEESWETVDTKNMDLEIHDDLTVQSKPSRLSNIFENLFRNSREHGGHDLTMHVGLLDNEDGFYIEDTGPGIDDDMKEKVLEHGVTTNEDGTGFGLSIITQIAEAHDWDVTVEDGKHDDGARFEFHFND